MLLVVDVGNTQTHFGTFQGEELLEHWRFATVRESTADQLGAALRNLLELRGVAFEDLSSSILSSTVPHLEPEWTAMAERYLGHEMLIVGPGLKTGMAIRYDNPREIGADRLVNALALRDRFGGPAVCVDFGTATTFDVVSAEGEYIGGSLMTGIEISLDALTERGARLPKVELAPPRSVIAKNTIDAIRSGVVYGYAGADRRDPASHLRRARCARLRSIATGGLVQPGRPLHRGDRRGRRPAHADRTAPDP